MDRDYLLIKLRALMLDIIGVEIYYIDIDADLIAKESFDHEEKELFKKSINEEFNIDIDFLKLQPFSLEKIADFIMQEKSAKEVISPAKEKRKIQYLNLNLTGY